MLNNGRWYCFTIFAYFFYLRETGTLSTISPIEFINIGKSVLKAIHTLATNCITQMGSINFMNAGVKAHDHYITIAKREQDDIHLKGIEK